jgi:methyl-accepting chemotaxis protein PixJ
LIFKVLLQSITITTIRLLKLVEIMDLSTNQSQNHSAVPLTEGTNSKSDLVQKVKKSLFKQERDRLYKVVRQIRQSSELNDFLQKTTTVIQTELKVDRVAIYRFENEYSGRVVAEALISGWTPALDSVIPCICFGASKASDYQSQDVVAIDDVGASQLTPHQKQLLEGFQIQASLALPIMLDSYSSQTTNYTLNEVWGLLIVQQCSQPRQWQEDEINLLDRLTIELTRILQPPIPRLQSGAENLVTVVERETQQSMQKMLHQIRQLIKVDRVLIYSFNPDWSGEVLAQSVDSEWSSAAVSFDRDCFLNGENYQAQYVVNDIYARDFASCLIAALEAIQAKAYMVIPVKSGDRLIGILGAYQNSRSRNWQESEIKLMHDYAAKFSLPLQQSNLLRHSQFYAQQVEKFAQGDILTAIEREQKQSMQQKLDQIRQFLKADRALIYGFNPDWSGKILAESVDGKWNKAGASFDRDCFLTEENCQERYVVNDIYKEDFAACLIEAYEAIEAKAYIAIPVKAKDGLLGMLVVYQNSAPRAWEQSEIQLTSDYAAKFSSDLKSTLSLRHAQFHAKQVEKLERQDAIAVIEGDARQSMQGMLERIRQLLRADRVLIYSFNADGSGEIITESRDAKWTKAANSFDNDCFLTTENCQPKYVVNDIYARGFAPCLIEELEALEAKAYIAIPVKSGDRLLGMLTVFQNSGSRTWQESEVQLMLDYATKFSLPLQKTSFIRTARFQAKQLEKNSDRDFLTTINQEAQQSMQNWLDKIRSSMKLDRTVIYGFNPDWSGEVLAESYGSNWNPTGAVLDRDFHFKSGTFEPYYLANDVQSKGLARAVLEKFEQMQARAYIVVPVHVNNQLLGVLGVYQNSAPRNWQESEVMQVREYAHRFIKLLQQTSFWRNSQFQSKQMEQSFKREKSLSQILEKVRLSKDEQAVFQITTNEGRKILDVDRVAIYRFNDDWSGNFIAESTAPGWSNLLEIVPFIEDTFLQNTKGGRYKNGESFAVEDIYLAGHKECHIELLEQMEARAYVLAPIFIADSNMFGSKKLWGLIGIYQNTGARRWQNYEIDVVRQLGLQVGIALQQISYINRLQKQAELEKASNNIIERIRKASNVDDIFRVATNEVRNALKADRAVVYQFNADWSGRVVAESVAGGWMSLLVEQESDEMLSGNRTKSDRCILRKWSVDDLTDTDTYLQSNRGGKYLRGKKFTMVDDIYTKKFPECYVASLEKYQARAYIITPIFQDDKLWGLLGVYQNSGTRNWEQSEGEQMVQIANQLAIAIQQLDYFEQLRIQSENLTKTLDRERAAKEELQKQAVEMLRTVRPAFKGDLTVRANVTENEIGTIAGAYNTTLDSLKDIVQEVQAAAEQVAQTTGNSSIAIEGLSMQSQRQLEELNQALDRVQAMMDASSVTTQNAQKVEAAIEQANQTVQTGDRAMNDTVDSIISIRETVADAGKRVKKLSDSSQKISKVVSLIGTFATQTNLLALNAALEATRAGEYGKGFAVVADEVRNLSLQSSEATTEIEKLVREIQEETREVAAAMEAGIEQVVDGTNLVNTTRESLNQIVTATAEIRGLVQSITSAANAQTHEAESVTRVMGQVAEIANETSQDSDKISASFRDLEQLAQNLQARVSQFKVK